MSRASRRYQTGVAHFRRGDFAAARRDLQAAAELAPRDAAVREAHAETLARLQRLDEAGAEARAALELSPGRASLLDLLGRAALAQGDHAAALRHLGESLAVRPAHAGTLVNLATVLHRIGEWEAAVSAGEAALRLEPGSLAARLGLSLALAALGRTDEGLAVLAPAGPHPMARFNAGFLQAQRGELAEGLAHLEARLERTDPGAGLGRLWQGEPVDGLLLVVPEQGLGDALLMCGFLPALTGRARAVAVQAPPPLARLFSAAFPGLRVVTSAAGLAPAAHVSILSLAHHAGVRSREDFPPAPWLPRTAERPPSPRPRVGLNWAGNPRYAFDAIRSAPLAAFAPLLEETGVEWVSLHKGAREHEAVAAGLPAVLEGAADFLDTAHAIAGLDLVVSTETAIPNLSAALGVPTVVLTSPAPDWRWRHAYTGITVAAQRTLGDWSHPIAVARAAVRSITGLAAAA